MFLVYSDSIPNKIYDINSDVSGFSSAQQFTSGFQPITSFFSYLQGLSASCQYPISVNELFPYWLRIQGASGSALISLTEEYYQWLSCNSTDIRDVSFLKMEDLFDVANVPVELLSNLSNTYVNSLPPSQISNISSHSLRNLIENVKINLYSKKGTSSSVKYLISTLFGYDASEVSVSYPKRFVFRLNGGNFSWMQDNLSASGIYSPITTSFYPQLTGSRLNFSVLQDGDLWQEHSYVVNASGLTAEYYENIVKPILHPSGTKYFLNVKPEIFNDEFGGFNATSVITIYEIPKIENYAGYTLGSTQTIGYTFGCISGLTAPYYVFPSWDFEISGYPGVSFGNIYIDDFLRLSPLQGGTFPNETIPFCDV